MEKTKEKPIGKALKIVQDNQKQFSSYVDNQEKNKNLLRQLRAQIGECIENRECTCCCAPVDLNEIRRSDLTTQREWYISGMCIECQDAVFDEKATVTPRSKKEVN